MGTLKSMLQKTKNNNNRMCTYKHKMDSSLSCLRSLVTSYSLGLTHSAQIFPSNLSHYYSEKKGISYFVYLSRQMNNVYVGKEIFRHL